MNSGSLIYAQPLSDARSVLAQTEELRLRSEEALAAREAMAQLAPEEAELVGRCYGDGDSLRGIGWE